MLRVLDPDRQAGVALEQFQTMASASLGGFGFSPPQLSSSPGAPPASYAQQSASASASASAGDPGDPEAAAASAFAAADAAVQERALDEGADPRVEEFLKVLEEYRTKCEGEGNYEEAARATEQLASLRKQEEARRIKALKGRHIGERGEVAQAHVQQFADFNAAWDRYLAEYDAMATMYLRQMQERHAAKLREFQESLHAELMRKPLKFGRELLEWRAREQMLAKCVPLPAGARARARARAARRRRPCLPQRRLAADRPF